MRLVVFASGSSGNCALVRGENTNLLIDAGISLRRIRTALRGEGRSLEDIAGVLVTHEHSDHIAALPMLAKYTSVPVYAPGTAARYLDGQIPALGDRLHRIAGDASFAVGELNVTAFPTPHDTEQSVGYCVAAGDARLGFCTDTGHISEEMLRSLTGCGAALIEANHDLDMLYAGPYPIYLKKRILSARGHLSNDDCAVLARTLAGNGTRQLVLGHLSRENNSPSRAYETVRRVLDENGFSDVGLHIAPVDGALRLEI